MPSARLHVHVARMRHALNLPPAPSAHGAAVATTPALVQTPQCPPDAAPAQLRPLVR
jgi:hypothetical protein